MRLIAARGVSQSLAWPARGGRDAAYRTFIVSDTNGYSLRSCLRSPYGEDPTPMVGLPTWLPSSDLEIRAGGFVRTVRGQDRRACSGPDGPVVARCATWRSVAVRGERRGKSFRQVPQ